MKKQQAVGIDLGTTYSCIAHLNEHGAPISLANEEGEYTTPSVVLFDEEETIVGTEALRNSILQPDCVVMHAKRYIGDNMKKWGYDGRFYTPVDISALILRKLLDGAEAQIGPISRAVVTVPALFNDIQRQNTIEAGLKAGLDHVDIINEPVAAALCYVLGTEGLWFGELADKQHVMVYDLGGGTFDLSIVCYEQNEVTVVASGGDLELGGLDWNQLLIEAVCDKFDSDFNKDPRLDSSSLQALTIEVEQAKRSLSVRPKTKISCQHGGFQKNYPITEAKFRKLTDPLVARTANITRDLLQNNNMGWAHINAVLTVGGGTRMPMVREKLKQMSGTTLNQSLSPDQSIAHGAAYYAGMLLSNSDFARSILSSEATARLSKIKQHSINARALGILARDAATDVRIPHYLIPENTALPTEVTHIYGTVKENQKRVNLRIVESGTNPDDEYVELGTCVIEELPENLPEGSLIAVTISYDEQARVHVSAKDVSGGKEAHTEIIRKENLAQKEDTGGNSGEFQAGSILEKAPLNDELGDGIRIQAKPATKQPAKKTEKPTAKKKPISARTVDPDASEVPVPLCETCGESLDRKGVCAKCGPKSKKGKTPKKKKPAIKAASGPIIPDDVDIIDLKPGKSNSSMHRARAVKKKVKRTSGLKPKKPDSQPQMNTPTNLKGGMIDANEEEFWNIIKDV